ncbi:hypothetical protein BDZ85DRAFT_261862 [Elsinoe ampelina]|uniref:Uncharacterized protein n=1 Tax=Elsinoe ampelina TaxID=302913 RepID=A0A6A6GCY5_9PEZI|nr:hypothetical protein BDZ85DRAFT_261862 [Elsinoe ampelina]
MCFSIRSRRFRMIVFESWSSGHQGIQKQEGISHTRLPWPMVGTRRPPRPGSRILNASLLESVRDSSAIWATGNHVGVCRLAETSNEEKRCKGAMLQSKPILGRPVVLRWLLDRGVLPCRVGNKTSIMEPSDAFQWSVRRCRLYVANVTLAPKRERFLDGSCGLHRL